MRSVVFILAVLLAVILSGCEKYVIDRPDIPTNVSFSGDIQPIFNDNCIACHSGVTDPDLSEGEAYESLIDGEYVDTGDPEASIIYEALIGFHSDKATEEEKLYILGWITEGAENN